MDKKPFFSKITTKPNNIETKNLIPDEGFIKVAKPLNPPNLTSEEKVILKRKTNNAFNDGDILLASKIALTINYTDGIIRAGDYYYNKNDFIQALAFYKCAGDEGRVAQVAEKVAISLRAWIDSDNNL